MPPAIMNEAVNTINAPITGCGMINNRAAYFGMKATMTRIRRAGKSDVAARCPGGQPDRSESRPRVRRRPMTHTVVSTRKV